MSKAPERIIQDPQLEPFYKGIDEFCKSNLPLERVPSEDELNSPKVFSDPIERYVSIHPWEVALIDTLLFQRLRSIKQLGLAYLVYPTLGYSRFEHTIGVLGRLKQILGSLQENLQDDHSKEELTHITDQDNLNTIRLAALCHDLGHCLFSHVSEAVIEHLPGNDDYPSSLLISQAFDKLANRKIPFSEIFTCSLVYSPHFVDYLSKIGIPNISNHSKALKLAEKIAYLILGLPDEPKSLYLAQLMNSGLDIDKLDYMMRESLFSGITLGISLEWLFKKITVCSLPARQVPGGLLSRIRTFDHNSQFYVLSLKKGGQFAFEEFCIARLALHEKIYLHQKIRAAEAYLKTKLYKFVETVPPYSEAHRWLYLKETMIDFPHLQLPALPAQDLFSVNFPETAVTLGLSYLSERKLLCRAFAFGWQNSIAEPFLGDQMIQESGTDKLMNLVQTNPGELLNRIAANYNEIRELLSSREEVPDSRPEIIFDPPRLSTIQQGHDTLHIECPSRLSIRWTMPIDRIVDYYHRNRALAYVFSTRQHLPYVLLSAEKAVWDMFNVFYEQESFINFQVTDKTKRLKNILHELGYYAETLILQPISDFLNSVYAQKLVTNIAHKLGQYESRTKTNVTPASVTTFISQFPMDLQEVALEWLQHLDLVHPEDLLQTAIHNVLNSDLFDSCKSIGLCPLGSMSDSATRIAYDLRSIGDKYSPDKRIMIVPLIEALAQPLDGYIIYDDNINTGLQAINIVGSWLGKDIPPDLILKEEHVQELANESKKELKSKPLALTFAVGTEGACSKLMKQLVEIFGFLDEKLKCESGKILLKSSRVFSGKTSPFQHGQKLDLKEFILKVATEILISEGKTKEKAEEKALGYSSSETMVVFPYNCPTMTITALWISGTYKGNKWIPLIERSRRNHPTTGELIGEDG